MKALFITQKKDAPSTKWRLLQFIPHFKKAGVECDVEEMPAGLVAQLSLAGRASAFDLTFLQKRLLPKLVLSSKIYSDLLLNGRLAEPWQRLMIRTSSLRAGPCRSCGSGEHCPELRNRTF